MHACNTCIVRVLLALGVLRVTARGRRGAKEYKSGADAF